MQKSASELKAEEAFKESEHRFKDFAEASADWFWEMDAELRFTYMSPNVEEIVGVPPEWHYGKTREELLGDDYDREQWDRHLETLKAREPFRNFIYRRIGRDIKAKWLSASGVPIFNSQGVFQGYRGCGSDATLQKQAEETLRRDRDNLEKQVDQRTKELTRELAERKQMEEALRESERQLRLVTDSLPVVITYINPENRYAFANKMAEEWYAQPRGKLIGKHFSDVFAGEDRAVINPYRKRVLVGETVRAEETFSYPDGVTRTVDFVYVPHRTEQGEVAGFYALTIDITERKQIEEQLRRSQKLEAVGQVTGGVAHEFNNMLMAVIGNLEMLQESDLRDMPKAREKVERVLKSAFRGKDLTSRLLSYTGNRFNRPEIIDVGETVTGTIALLRPMLGETFVLETEVLDDLWPIEVDPGEFGGALTNLAINARDAMPDGGTITITCANAKLDDAFAASRAYPVETGDYVVVSVSDTGTGMSPEVVERAFDPFFSTKGMAEGTGLGLSMVYGFVHRQLGGHVDIETEEGRGTTVTLYFPRIKSL